MPVKPFSSDEASAPSAIPMTAAPLCSVLLHLLGEAIVNRRGQKLGCVDDLLVDPTTGCIAYVVMAWGGFMGRGERQLVLPWRALQRDPAQLAYVIDADDRRLEAAPVIDSEHGPAQRAPEWHLAVHRHYGLLPVGMPVGIGTTQR